MSLSLGYRGPAMMPSQFVDNPFDAVPDSTIRLCDYEVAMAVRANGCPDWPSLNPSQQREIARQILFYRGDAMSLLQMDWLGLNNPNMRIEVVTSYPSADSQQSSNPLLHCLL